MSVIVCWDAYILGHPTAGNPLNPTRGLGLSIDVPTWRGLSSGFRVFRITTFRQKNGGGQGHGTWGGHTRTTANYSPILLCCCFCSMLFLLCDSSWSIGTVKIIFFIGE